MTLQELLREKGLILAGNFDLRREEFTTVDVVELGTGWLETPTFRILGEPDIKNNWPMVVRALIESGVVKPEVFGIVNGYGTPELICQLYIEVNNHAFKIYTSDGEIEIESIGEFVEN